MNDADKHGQVKASTPMAVLRTADERGYALMLVMMALLLIGAMSGTMAISTQSDQLFSRTTSVNLQTQYFAEAGIEAATQWFTSSYRLPASSDFNTAAGTTVTDTLGKTFTTSVKTNNGPGSYPERRQYRNCELTPQQLRGLFRGFR